MRSPLEPDDVQARVLEHERGSLLVTGPPGSGKTALLRERYARLVESGVGPDRILLLTLNRRAAREGRDAVIHRLARSLPEVPVRTAHGLGFAVIGRRFEELGYRTPPHQLSAPEQYAVVRQMLDGESRELWPRFAELLATNGFARQLADFVLRAQERLLDADALEELVARSGREEYGEVAAFYRRYLDAQTVGDRIDFAGLLFQTIALLQRDLGGDAFEHVLVDDYQDATPATEGIVRTLAPAADSVVIAADPGGHVFSYAGGSLEPLRRLHEVVGGLSEVRLERSVRLGEGVRALAALDDPAADPAPASSGFEARLFAHPGEEADAVAHELLRSRVDEDVPWERMAIIVRRYGEYLTALRHALGRHGVPFVVVAEAAAVATEPANRPILELLRLVFQPRRREELLEPVLMSPLIGVDPHGLRELRRIAHMRGLSLLAFVESEDPVATPELAEPVERLRTILREAPAIAERETPDGLFYWLWSTLPWFASLVDSGERDLDALAALGGVLSRFVERRPGAGIEDYLETLDAAEFGPDPWITPEERYPHAVRVVSAHRAHGMEVDVALVVGCLEGEFPAVSRPEPVVDIEALANPRSPGDRLRARLAEERSLFRLAVSRATKRTILFASHSTSARNPRTPSRFAGRIGLSWGPEVVPPAASLRSLESALRRRLSDAEAPASDRLAALAALPRAGARPAEWWGGRDWTDPGVPLHAGEIHTSYSRFSVLENCALQYLYQAEMGLDPERSHQMWVGTLIHDLVDRVQRGELERSEDAVLAALDEAWRPDVFPNRAIERQRYTDSRRMVQRFLEDEGYGEVVASEEKFSFRLDGAEVHGRIDAVFRLPDGGLRVVDYKTARNKPTQDEVQRSLQLGAYYLAMRRVPEFAELGPPRILELAFLFIEGQSGRGFLHMPVNADRVTGYEEWAESTILELLETVRAEDFAPNPEADCFFCRFQPICPVWPQGAEAVS